MRTARQVILTEFGEPEKMEFISAELPEPAAGEVQLRQTAIGLNFIDIYQRKGTYPLPLPTRLGHEAAGVVEAVGSNVGSFNVGDRVAYMFGSSTRYFSGTAEQEGVPVPDPSLRFSAQCRP